jgi:hypothetical protein
MKKRRKPTGTTGVVNVSIDATGSRAEFVKTGFPDEKGAIEEQILTGTLRTARAMGLNLYQGTADPAKNDENDFDFTFPTANGKEHIDLVEVMLSPKGGYDATPHHFLAGERADGVVELVKKKDNKYGITRRTKVHLLLYTTDWRFHLPDRVLDLAALYCARKQHRLPSIVYYFPMTHEDGFVCVIYPRPPEAIALVAQQEGAWRNREFVAVDPMALRPSEDGHGIMAPLRFPPDRGSP